MSDVVRHIEVVQRMVPRPDADRGRRRGASYVQRAAIDTDHQAGTVDERRQCCGVAGAQTLPQRMVGARIENRLLVDQRRAAVPIQNYGR